MLRLTHTYGAARLLQITLALMLVASLLCPLAHAQDSIATLGAQAEQLEQEGRFTEAADAYRRILALDPGSIAALNRLGALYVRQGRFAEGTEFYQKALALDPSNFGTNLNLGIAYLRQQDYKSATQPLRQAALAQPANMQARQLLALSLVGQDDYEHAIPELKEIQKLSPHDEGNIYLLSRAYLQTQRFKEALAAFDVLEGDDPNSPWVHLLKGQAYDGLAEYDKSIEEFKAARQQQPGDATVLFSLGFMYWKVERFAEAEQELGKAVEIDPSFREARFYLADAYLTDLKPQLALPLLESLVAQDANYVRARLDLGKTLAELGRYPEAAVQLEAALRLDPSRSDAHYQLARVYRQLNEPDKVRQEMALSKKLITGKLHAEESVIAVTGARGDATQQLGLSPKRDAQENASEPH